MEASESTSGYLDSSVSEAHRAKKAALTIAGGRGGTRDGRFSSYITVNSTKANLGVRQLSAGRAAVDAYGGKRFQQWEPDRSGLKPPRR